MYELVQLLISSFCLLYKMCDHSVLKEKQLMSYLIRLDMDMLL